MTEHCLHIAKQSSLTSSVLAWCKYSTKYASCTLKL